MRKSIPVVKDVGLHILSQNDGDKHMTEQLRSQNWKKHSGFIAWPTVILSLFIVLSYVATSAMVYYKTLPLWSLCCIHIILSYLAFTPMHEAAHNNIHGQQKGWKWLNEAIGWFMSIPSLAPFSLFRTLHLKHHGCTNHPEKDPDFWVAGKGLISIFLRCLTIIPHYYYWIVCQSSNKSFWRKEKWAIITTALFWSLIAGLFYQGHGYYLLFLWILPGIIASTLLAFMFDWVPHSPHEETRRFLDTRIIIFPGLEIIMTSQNYHLIHHLYPRIPFYRYRDYFLEIREDLEEKGSPIVDFRKNENPKN